MSFAPKDSRGFLNWAGKLAAEPTTALPGSPEKVAVLAERARLGLSLWHPADARHVDRPAPVEADPDAGEE